MAVKKQETEAAVQAAPEKDTEVIRLFKDNQRYKTPVFVGVNGETYLIQRGVDVEVPKAVAEVLRHSEEMDGEAMARSWRRKALLCSRRSACKAEEHSSCKEKSILQNENRHPVQRHMAVPGVFAAEATAGCGRKNAGSRDLRSRS